MPVTPIDPGRLLTVIAAYEPQEDGTLTKDGAVYTLDVRGGFWEIAAGADGRRLHVDDYNLLRGGTDAGRGLFTSGPTYELCDRDGWASAEPA